MNGEDDFACRFLVRQGCKGWMVYDRQRKGPALVGTNPAVELTQERANTIKQMLIQSYLRERVRPTSPDLRR